LVEETTQTTGSGTYVLDGAPLGRRTFVQGIGNGTRTLYKVESGATYELGIGTVTSGAPSVLSRDSVRLSTNNNLAVNWGPGSKRIFCDLSAELANQIFSRPGGALPLGAVETRGPLSFSGAQSVLEFTGIASTAKVIHIGWSNIARNDSSPLLLQLGDSGGYEATGYVNATHWGTAGGRGLEIASTAIILAATGLSGNAHFGHITLTNLSTGFFSYSGGSFSTGTQIYTDHFVGAKFLTAALDRIRMTNGAANNFGAGGSLTTQIIHALS
jgi:hypothetical protein